MKGLIRSLAFSLLLVGAHALAAGSISPQQLQQEMRAGKTPLIVDVRTEDEYLAGHIPTARLIPVDKIGEYTDSLAKHKDARIIVYCQTGSRAQRAAKKLEASGFSKVEILQGSFAGWKKAGGDVAK